MSQSACSIADIAESATSLPRQKPCRYMRCHRKSIRVGSSAITNGVRSSTAAATARSFRSSVPSPQPCTPSSVVTLTNT
jgi:hypothetical protein